MEVLTGVILALLLKKQCAGGRADIYHPHSINGSASSYYLHIIIESHKCGEDGVARLSRVCGCFKSS